jgi:methyltransferase (TIGR00027 family)
MEQSTFGVRNISDTARWVAYFRAVETRRPDALFRDPYAERLAGERGLQIAQSLPDGDKHEWAWMARTYLFDRFVMEQVNAGADTVLCLAAGLDARPYRLNLPPSLQWIEVDLPDIVTYKEEILAGEVAACTVKRFRQDLRDVDRRCKLFAELNLASRKIVVLTEGLLIYLTCEEVSSLSRDIAAGDHFSNWIIDLASPGQLKIMQRTTGVPLRAAGASFQFAPSEGPNFFKRFGWEPRAVEGLLKTAAKLNRAPKELLALLPEPKAPFGNYPWTGVCSLGKVDHA